MDQNTCKNDVKTLFFIFNTFSGIGVGLEFFSSGVGTGVLKGMQGWDIACIVIGLLYVGVGFLGYCAAMAGNKKMLNSYSSVMFMTSISNVLRLVLWGKQGTASAGTGPGMLPKESLAAMIFVTIVTMVSMLLSITLMAYADKDAKQPKRTVTAT